MKIIVCVKQVPDTASKIKLKSDKEILSEGLQFIVNPYDEFALEEALRIKEKFKEGEVVVISSGPERVKETLRTTLATGADRAILIKQDTAEAKGAFAVASQLAEIIRGMEYDLILCGKQAVDDYSFQVGGLLAELLNIPHIAVINKLEIGGDKKNAAANRVVEGGSESWETTLPAVFTCEKGLNEPRLPSLKGIMSAKKKELKEVSVSDNGKNLELSFLVPAERKAGKIMEGESIDKVKNLIKLLKEEAKVI